MLLVQVPSVYSASFVNGSTISLNVSETASTGSVLHTFEVQGGTDVRYSISGLSTGEFAVRPNGELYVSSSLDYEMTQSYRFLVNAEDSGVSLGTVSVNIQVDNENDNTPLFTMESYTIYLPYSGTPHTVNIQGHCRDNDEPPYNTVEFVFYTNSSTTTEESLFNVEPYGAIQRIQDIISTEHTERYSIVIICRDPDNKADSATYTLVTQELNEGPPEFSPPHVFSVNETNQGPTSVGSVTLTDPNDGDEIFAEITGGQFHSFSLTKMSDYVWELVYRPQLDRETVSSASVEITARDGIVGIYRTMESRQTYTLNILDINDHAPRFDMLTIEVSIPRSHPVTVPIVSPRCTDQDDGINAEISYSILSGQQDLFTINENNGSIYLSTDVDRSRLASGAIGHHLTIRCSDKGEEPMTATAIVAIIVPDNNTAAPMFIHSSSLTVTIPENTPVGSSLIDINATDSDGDPITYSIVHFQTSGTYFSINNETGLITIIEPLDYDDGPQMYIFTAVASDTAGLSSSAGIQVTVTNVDDQGFEFQGQDFSVDLPESNDSAVVPEVRRNFYTASCIDPDNLTNSILYRLDDIRPTPRGFTFEINRNNGSLSANTTIDYEMLNANTSQYNLDVRCYSAENASQFSTQTVSVTITGVNEYLPDLTYQQSSTSANEDFGLGGVVISLNSSIAGLISVTPFDRDRGANFYYELATNEDEGFFAFDNERNVVETASELDVDILGSNSQMCSNRFCAFTLTITVCDEQQSNDHCSSDGFMFYVLTLNDEEPQFSMESYNVTVDENVPLNTEVVPIECTDRDVGIGSTITVTIVGVPALAEVFRITPEGVFNKQFLDYESQQSYYFVLRCSDTVFSDQASVYINVNPVNEHPPVFVDLPSSGEYVFNISRTTTVLSIVGTITVEDRDEGVGGDLTFSLLPLDSYFQYVEESNGIQLLQDLSSGNIPTHNYTLNVTDGFSTISASITINVLGGNYHQPMWVEGNGPRVISVRERETLGTVVHMLQCSDRDDAGSVNSLISYSITSDTSRGAFVVNESSGNISVNQEIVIPADVSSLSFTLGIRCADHGDPVMMATGFLYINIQPVPINPTINISGNSSSNILISVREDLEINDIVTNITTQNFVIGDFDCRLDDSLFYVTTSYPKCVLRLKAELDAETLTMHSFSMEVTDNLNTIVISAAVYIQDVNDNRPNCSLLQGATVSVNIDAAPGHVVIEDLGCHDVDFGPNGLIVYSLENSFFDITPPSSLTVKRTLAMSNSSRVFLEINVSDSGTETVMSTILQLTVVINPVNTAPPVFTNLPNSTLISESTDLYTVVFTVSATDADVGYYGEVEYRKISGDTEGFFIVEGNGRVRLLRRLDATENNVFVLGISASDTNLTTEASLNITVMEINDFSPECTNTAFYFTIFEEETEMVEFPNALDCNDNDNGLSGSIVYNKLPGPHSRFLSIGPTSGTVSIVETVDYETYKELNVTVSVSDMGDPSLSTTVSVIVAVDPVNEYDPVVENVDLEEDISENTAVDTLVFSLTITDRDRSTHKDGQISATLSGEGSTDFELQQLDNNIFEVRIASSLNYERQTEYRMTLVATDRGQMPRSSTASLIVSVTNVNDISPTFEQSLYTANVMSDAPRDTVVLPLVCTDVEDGSNVTIELVSPPAFLSVDSSGNVVVSGTLPSSNGLHSFEARCTDSGAPALSSSVQVSVFVFVGTPEIDFISTSLRTSVSESLPVIDPDLLVNSLVMRIGVTSNYAISYSILSSNFFFIEERTGNVRLKRALDYETTQSHTFTVRAFLTTNQSVYEESQAQVDVVNENDNSPSFLNTSVNLQLTEESREGLTNVYVLCEDADLESFGTVSYTLSADNTPNIFGISESSGAIFFLSGSSPNYEVNQAYTLTVTCSDGNFSDSLDIFVEILPVNEFAPLITSSTTVSVTEELSVGSLVKRITSEDMDHFPHDVVRYYITSGNMQGTFSLNSETGSLFLLNRLDYEEETSYRLEIEARDDGEQGSFTVLSSSVSFEISVTDENDNTPMFTQDIYSFQVGEEAAIETTVGSVNCTDLDSGSNGVQRIFLEDTNVPFRMISSVPLGFLQVSSALSPQPYILHVVCADGGSEPRSSSALVIVTVQPRDGDINFLRNPYLFELTETEADVNTNIGTITAYDNSTNVFTYSLINASTDVFNLDPNTGRLTLLRDLDYENEMERMFDFFVEATSSTSGSRRVAIVVTITDVNDAPPMFSSGIYVAKIREALQPPQTVSVLLQCTDEDDDNNAGTSVRYSLMNTTQFRIDPLSGVLSTVAELDVETSYEHEFTVVCTDSSGLTASSTVRITVDPFNEFPPQFTRTQYTGEVVEGRSPVNVVTVIASDEDFIRYGTVEYSIVGGNEEENFDIISTTGVIFVSRALDYETQSEYRLNVSASDIVPDGDESGSVEMAVYTTVIVNVIDVNDVTPLIEPNFVVINNLQRDSPNNTIATTFTCSDRDSGGAGQVAMSLLSGDMGDFILQDGVLISVDTPLLPSYTIKVICEDFGSPSLTATAVAFISPNSTNVNAPMFVNLQETVLLLPEDLNRTDCLYTVSATDGDDPNTPDGMFSFSMTPAIDEEVTYFDIDNELSCIKAVDANQIDLGDRNNDVTIVYQLTVEDQGVPALTTSATIEIKITANSPPSFPDSVDPVDLNETDYELNSITSFPCTDVDLSDPLTMSIIGGNTDQVFGVRTSPKTVINQVGSVTGTLFMNPGKQLDYDQGSRGYTLTVQCSDGRLQVITTVSVNVLPVNEFDPVFSVPGVFRVPENAYSGYRITTLESTDMDAGEDGVVKFRFAIADRRFNLAETGELTMVGPFDFDGGQQRFLLMVESYDRADSTDTTTRRTSTNEISVHLTNVNDVAPVFPEGADYNFSVKATSFANSTVIGNVSCMDGDDSTDTVIRYTLLNDVMGLFSVDSESGEVIAMGDLFQRQFDNYALQIQCSDNGYPILYSVTEVNVKVLEQNEYSPVFTTVPSGDLRISELFNLTSVIFTFVATDNDTGVYGRVTYTIETAPNDSGIFTIDPLTGELKLLRMLDYEEKIRYTLGVIATDGLEDSTDRMSVSVQIVVDVQDVNEHDPACTQPLYLGYFRMDASFDDVILTLDCSDDDISDALTYVLGSYSPENNNAPFHLVGQTNSTIVYRTLVPPMSRDDYYAFTVIVSDPRGRSTTVDILIATLFENDNDPQFDMPTYSLTVPEDATLGASVANFTAMDGDRGIQGEVTYSLTGPDADYFRINQESGEMLLSRSLDTEDKPQLSLVVVATDKDPFNPRSSSASVNVSVMDVNDNAPFCDPGYLTEPILSDATPDTVIAVLNCSDNDRLPINRLLTFSLSPDTRDHPFEVHTSTGEIVPSGVLTPSTSFFFTVVVSDGGNPSLSSEVDVVVEVYRQNQEPPVFGLDEYHFVIDETIEVLSVIGELNVTDEDSLQENLRFTITESNPDFHVDFETGLVRVTAPMDYEQQSTFMFEVQVEDGGSYNGMNVLTDTATVSVTIVNVNDHEPELSDSGIYGTTVNVTTVVGASVLEFECTDEDDGDFGVVTVDYEPRDIPFRLQQDSVFTSRYRFEVSTNLREDGGISYTANITCTDGTHTTRGQVFIAILHPGDPMFTQIVYQWDVPEDAPYGENYTEISANTNSGTSLTYTITSGNSNGLFRIDPNSAVLSLAFSLDYEEQRRHGLVVRATDGNGNFSEVLAIVNVLDVSEDSDLAPPSATITVEHSRAVNDPFGTLKCTNGTVRRGDRYNFTFVPSSNIFSVDDIGILRLLQQLDETPVYVLPVFCHNVLTPDEVASGIVTIRVIFENKYTPVFDLSTYSVLLSEDYNVSEVVKTVVARDRDIGSFGVLEYSIQSGNTGNKFYVNSTTGDISLLSSLDYETLQSYNLTVIAVDGGTTAPDSNRKTGTTTVTVRVQDTNDNAPLFSQSLYEAAILTDHVVLESVLNTSCTDADSGVNMQFDYSIRPESTKFAINSDGVIILREELVSEDVYTLRVVCTDRGRPSLSSTSQAIIIVSPVDVGAPQFNQSSYHTSIAEDHPILGDFYQVTATPANPTIQVSYSIVGGDGNETFGIESHSGTLFTTNRLNAVQKSEYYVLVSATNVGTNALSSSNVTVVISVTDVNNNAPMFQPGNYYRGVVEETATRGTQVVTVTCEDSDLPENSEVSYRVTSVNSLFDVNSEGVVFVDGELDYETTVEHTVLVECRDSGEPPQSSMATVVVRVTAVNEHAPMFVKSNYTFDGVAEDTGFGEVIGTVSATDDDNGIHSSISYRLGDNGLYSSFQVDSLTGVITVSRSLDFETEQEHSLIVIAEDEGGETDTADVTILLSDVNDNDPILFPTAVVVELQINTSVGFAIQRFACSDVDTVPREGTALSIETDTSEGKFTLREDDMLVVNEMFDSPALYTVKIRCVDHGSRAAVPSGVVAVTVYENRDLIPRFQPSGRYTTSVPEGTHINRLVVRVTATSETSALITYQLHDGDDRFSVEQSTGQVRVNGTLNVRVQKVHNIIVSATANGHSSLAVVVVNVQDINDNAPRMVIPEGVSVAETAQPPVALTTILCRDDDEGSNGETAVSLGDDTLDDVFAVTAEGILSLVGAVDYDGGVSRYNVSLTCSDAGAVPMTTTGFVYVSIDPVNEYAPQFFPSTYQGMISEDVGVNEHVLLLNISDRDDGEDGEFSVRISSSVGASDFTLTDNSRRVVVNRQLNATLRGIYTLEAVATDFGSPTPRTGFAEITVTVTDVNESPYFSELSYSYVLSEESVVGTPVGDVVCRDGDINSNAALTVELLSTSDSSNFVLLPVSSVTGTAVSRIFTNTYPITADQELTVRCSDDGDTSLMANVSLSVTIIPMNENPPVFRNLPSSVTVGELDNPPVRIYMVDATDVETPNALRYEIVDGNFGTVFNLDETSGDLTLVKTVDYELESSYSLLIRVYDGSPVNTLQAESYLYVNISNLNDIPPVLTGPIAVTLEEQNTTSSLVEFSCVDEDNFQIQFSIEGDVHDQFNIDSRLGYVVLKRPLDYETASTHTIDIVCTDKPSPLAGAEQSASITLTVTVTPVNLFPPVFSNNSYLFRVAENTIVGAPVLVGKVTATDPDNRRDAQIKYTIVAKDPDLPVFSLDSVTGDLFLVSFVDRETDPTFHLVVKADDGDTIAGSLTSTVNVTIRITDINDNVPTCTNETYVHLLYEGQYDNYVLSALDCQDIDEGPNSNLTYTIVSESISGGVVFEWNVNQGVVTLTGTVQPGVLDLSVLVSDQGTPSLSISVQVILNIVVNDTVSLRFNPFIFSVDTREDSNIGYIVANGSTFRNALVAGNGMTPEFSLISNVEIQAIFSVEQSTGNVILKRLLNYENRTEYGLVVQAFDGNYTARATLIVRVVDVNDNPPVFMQSNYSITIDEETKVENVTQVHADDVDTGLGGVVVYELVSEEEFFAINRHTGDISIIQPIDHEVFDRLLLQVIARDLGEPSFSSSVFINVTITNINDNNPEFAEPQYLAYTTNSDPVGTVLIQLSAFDKDNLAPLDFSVNPLPCPDPTLPPLDEVTNLFGVDDATQELRLIETLPQDLRELYYFTVRVSDGERVGETCVKVVVRRVTLLEAAVLEHNFETRTFVYDLTQKVAERGFAVTASTQYTIISGNTNETFVLESLPGSGRSVVNVKPLDRESISEYRLFIDILDEGGLNVTVLLRVIVQDVNDNRPIFESDSYMFSVSEGPREDLGPLPITQLSAKDDDILLNGFVTFYLLENPLDVISTALFTLDSSSGELSLLGILDREVIPRHVLTVRAIDAGSPTQYSDVNVTIEVMDINDNSPVFLNPITSASILPGASPGTLLVALTATDADIGSNGEIDFAVSVNHTRQLFRVETSNRKRAAEGNTPFVARIVANDVIREEYTNITVTISASDRGPSPNRKILSFTLQVKNTPPSFSANVYTAQVLHGEEIGASVLSITATDKDQQIVTYKKTLRNEFKVPFAVASDDGDITVVDTIGLNWPHKYLFDVVAEDSNLPVPGSSTATVVVNIYNTSHLLIVESCQPEDVWQEPTLREEARNVLEVWFNQQGLSGSLFIHNFTKSDEDG